MSGCLNIDYHIHQVTRLACVDQRTKSCVDKKTRWIFQLPLPWINQQRAVTAVNPFLEGDKELPLINHDIIYSGRLLTDWSGFRVRGDGVYGGS